MYSETVEVNEGNLLPADAASLGRKIAHSRSIIMRYNFFKILGDNSCVYM